MVEEWDERDKFVGADRTISIIFKFIRIKVKGGSQRRIFVSDEVME